MVQEKNGSKITKSFMQIAILISKLFLKSFNLFLNLFIQKFLFEWSDISMDFLGLTLIFQNK